MKELLLKRWPWVTAVVLMCAGIILSWKTVVTLRDTEIRLDRKFVTLEQLQGMAVRIREGEAARDSVVKRSTAAVPSLIPLQAEMMMGYKPDDSREGKRELQPGWIVREMDFSYGDVPFSAAMEFVKRAESSMPPWRLTRCTLRVSPNAEATGQVLLHLEALEKLGK